MGNKLEQLLNSLIEKGWKPFWDERIVPYVKIDYRQIAFYKLCDDWMYQWLFDTDIRTVLSKESLLWQFVCENKMVRLETDSWENDSYRCYYNDDGYPKDYFFEMERDDYRFWLIESALKDESELEDFLLSNIKIEWQ